MSALAEAVPTELVKVSVTLPQSALSASLMVRMVFLADLSMDILDKYRIINNSIKNNNKLLCKRYLSKILGTFR